MEVFSHRAAGCRVEVVCRVEEVEVVSRRAAGRRAAGCRVEVVCWVEGGGRL